MSVGVPTVTGVPADVSVSGGVEGKPPSDTPSPAGVTAREYGELPLATGTTGVGVYSPAVGDTTTCGCAGDATAVGVPAAQSEAPAPRGTPSSSLRLGKTIAFA